MHAWLKHGRVLKCWIDDLRDSHKGRGKWKFCIVVGYDSSRDQVLLVLVNSRISNAFAQSNPDYGNAQFALRKADYNHILEYDSWIDCFQLSKIRRTDVVEQLRELSPPAKDYGVLRQTDLEQVIELLNTYGDLSQRDRTTINRRIT
jgi:hypothetical protein